MYGLPSAIPINLRSNLIEDACQSLGAKVKKYFSRTSRHSWSFFFMQLK